MKKIRFSFFASISSTGCFKNRKDGQTMRAHLLCDDGGREYKSMGRDMNQWGYCKYHRALLNLTGNRWEEFLMSMVVWERPFIREANHRIMIRLCGTTDKTTASINNNGGGVGAVTRGCDGAVTKGGGVVTRGVMVQWLGAWGWSCFGGSPPWARWWASVSYL